MPGRPFPAYAYLPGRMPHPVRDAAGHSHGAAPHDAPGVAWRWGLDLFNHGYYWEAHEAWEGPWRAAADEATRALLKGLILLAAAGVKLREGKDAAAVRHAGRAAALFRAVDAHGFCTHGAGDLVPALGLSGVGLAAAVDAAVGQPPQLQPVARGGPQPVFGFVLGGGDATASSA